MSAVGSIANCLPCTELPGPPDQTKLAGWGIRPSKVMGRRGEIHVLRGGVTRILCHLPSLSGSRITKSELKYSPRT